MQDWWSYTFTLLSYLILLCEKMQKYSFLLAKKKKYSFCFPMHTPCWYPSVIWCNMSHFNSANISALNRLWTSITYCIVNPHPTTHWETTVPKHHMTHRCISEEPPRFFCELCHYDNIFNPQHLTQRSPRRWHHVLKIWCCLECVARQWPPQTQNKHLTNPTGNLCEFCCHYCMHTHLLRLLDVNTRVKPLSNSLVWTLQLCSDFFKTENSLLICSQTPQHKLSLLLSAAFYPLTPPLISVTEVAKKVPLLDLHAAYSLSSISCYCWQLSWSPSIDPSPWKKIRWGIEMDSISII